MLQYWSIFTSLRQFTELRIELFRICNIFSFVLLGRSSKSTILFSASLSNVVVSASWSESSPLSTNTIICYKTLLICYLSWMSEHGIFTHFHVIMTHRNIGLIQIWPILWIRNTWIEWQSIVGKNELVYPGLHRLTKNTCKLQMYKISLPLRNLGVNIDLMFLFLILENILFVCSIKKASSLLMS